LGMCWDVLGCDVDAVVLVGAGLVCLCAALGQWGCGALGVCGLMRGWGMMGRTKTQQQLQKHFLT
jgi:hypothetical protein